MKKPKKHKIRNWHAVAAWTRNSAGPMLNKKKTIDRKKKYKNQITHDD